MSVERAVEKKPSAGSLLFNTSVVQDGFLLTLAVQTSDEIMACAGLPSQHELTLLWSI